MAYENFQQMLDAAVADIMDCDEHYVLQDDFATTSTSAIDIPGMEFAIGADEDWTFVVVLKLQSTGTAGMKFAVATPSGATLMATVVGTGNTLSPVIQDTLDTPGALSSSFVTLVTSNGIVTIQGSVRNGATPGVVKMQVAKVTSGTATIVNGSFLNAHIIT